MDYDYSGTTEYDNIGTTEYDNINSARALRLEQLNASPEWVEC